MQLVSSILAFSIFPGLKHKEADQLRRAAADGNVAWVSSILSGRTTVDPKKKAHTSALQMACRYGHLDVVEALVAKGADVNRIATDGTALMEAAAFGHQRIVAFLLQNKADPQLGMNGDLPVHRAARFGQIGVLRMLSELPVGPDMMQTTNSEGKSPLMMACCMTEGGKEAIQFLIDLGADVTAADKAGNTPLHMAAMAGNTEAIQLLLSTSSGKIMLRASNGMGRTALHLAAAYGRDAAARALIERKADVGIADQNGSTVLHMLCKSVMFSTREAQTSIAKMMLDSGADPQAKDSQGHSSADYADAEPLMQLLSSSVPSSSSSGEGPSEQQPVRAPAQFAKVSKKELAQGALQEGLATSGVSLTVASEGGADPTGADATTAFLIKQALRKHTSEEPDGWKLGAEVEPQ